MDRCCEISWSIAERLDQPFLNWSRAYMRALRALLAGDTDDAEALAKEALRIGTASGEPEASLFCGSQLAAVRRQRGTRVQPDIPVLEQLIATLPGLKEEVIATMAAAYLAASRLDDAHRLLEQFAAADFELRTDPVTWLHTMVSYAAVAVGCRDTGIAASLFDRLEPFADQVPTNTVVVREPVSHYLGELAAVLGRAEIADAYFTRAAAFSGEVGAKFFAAHTNLAWAEMLIERAEPGDIDTATRLLGAAHATAVIHGYKAIEQRADGALELLHRS
jgi:tetratricopeptide (TPR) repeat protein